MLSRAEEFSTPMWDLLRQNRVLGRYLEFGTEFVDAAMQRLADPAIVDRLANGSDRLVKFSDNQEVVNEIRSELALLETALREDNEIGDALGDQREEAIHELSDLKSAMERSSGRASYLLGISQRFLTWLGKLAAKTSAEKIVGRLTKLFMDWLL
jgi:hypothetical protein